MERFAPPKSSLYGGEIPGLRGIDLRRRDGKIKAMAGLASPKAGNFDFITPADYRFLLVPGTVNHGSRVLFRPAIT